MSKHYYEPPLIAQAGDSPRLFRPSVYPFADLRGQSLNASISAIQLNTVSANTSGKK